MVGKTISHYKIIKKLGQGGMGEVFLAEDTQLGRKVALKFLPIQYTVDANVNKRFRREAKAAAGLNHPNIITIHEIAEHEGRVYIVMEYIEGQSLRQMIKQKELTIDQVFNITAQISEGLKMAHRAGIVHRDLKPENILLDKESRAVILDFGLAQVQGVTKLTTETSTLGTINYMSPEQCQGATVDLRADIWAVGVLLYEMITGKLPFEGDYEQAIMYSISHEEPEPMARYKQDVPVGWQRIVEKALDKDPETRYQHIDDLLSDLKREKKSTTEYHPVKKTKKPLLKQTPLSRKSVAIFLAVIAIFVIYLIQRKSENQIPVNHTQLTFVGNAAMPAISPDNQFMAYTTGFYGSEQKLFVQDLSGVQPLEISRNKLFSELKWSPDGTEIVFVTVIDSIPEIHILPRLGGKPQKLGFALWFLSWSPDGSKIAGSGIDLHTFHIINKLTGNRDIIKLDTTFTWLRGLDWSPTGDWLLFLTQHSQKYTIWSTTTSGQPIHKIIEDNAQMYCPLWSSNGDAIYYFRSQDQTKDLMKIAVNRKTGMPSGVTSIVQTGLQAGDYFTLSTDGKRLLYSRMQESSNLWLVMVEDSLEIPKVKTKQLTSGTSVIKYPSISPDGKQLAFSVGMRPGIANIFTMSLEGGEMHQVTFLQSLNYNPVWSPDGTQIAFGSTQGDGNTVWLVNADGGVPRQFSQTKLSDDFQLTWSPGPDILYQRLGQKNFHFLNPESEDEQPLLKNEITGAERDIGLGGVVQFIHKPFYSPDAKKIAVQWSRWSADYDSSGIWSISLEDGLQRFLYNRTLIFPIGWSTDGQWIYAVEGEFSENKTYIVMINQETTQTKKLTTLPFSPNEIDLVTMTLDGKHFICTVFDRRSDVWLMENFDTEVK